MRLVFLIICVIVVLFILYHLFPAIQVVGDSMYATYIDGEVIFGTRLYRKSKLKKGDVIVYKSPTEKKVVIKRIFDIEIRDNVPYFYCLGDNANVSYDSRYYGFVSSKNLVCKVLNQRRNENLCM